MHLQVFRAAFKGQHPAKAGTPYTAASPRLLQRLVLTRSLMECQGLCIPHESLRNPEGIVSSSPGLRAASYPGKRESTAVNPNGVAATVPTRVAATPLGLAPSGPVNP